MALSVGFEATARSLRTLRPLRCSYMSPEKQPINNPDAALVSMRLPSFAPRLQRSPFLRGVHRSFFFPLALTGSSGHETDNEDSCLSQPISTGGVQAVEPVWGLSRTVLRNVLATPGGSPWEASFDEPLQQQRDKVTMTSFERANLTPGARMSVLSFLRGSMNGARGRPHRRMDTVMQLLTSKAGQIERARVVGLDKVFSRVSKGGKHVSEPAECVFHARISFYTLYVSVRVARACR